MYSRTTIYTKAVCKNDLNEITCFGHIIGGDTMSVSVYVADKKVGMERGGAEC